MLKKIGLGLVALILVFVVVVATRPSSFHYERSTTIAAPPDAVYPLVSDFHQWTHWSPWDKLDPSQQRTFEGAAAGLGARYAWKGNDKVGEGRMAIEEAKAGESIKIKLEFIKPFASTNTTTFVIKPEGAGVKLTWAMEGTNNFMSKAFGLFMDMDKMIGSDFDRGLAQIKQLAEAEGARKKPAEPAGATPAAAVEKK
ncbi:MAG: SRPBCC family protein [Minicystis sp.]